MIYKLLNLIDFLFAVYVIWNIQILLFIPYVFIIKTLIFLYLSRKNFFSFVNLLNLLDLATFISYIFNLSYIKIGFACYILIKSLLTLF